jgi:hypothetical protein
MCKNKNLDDSKIIICRLKKEIAGKTADVPWGGSGNRMLQG